MPSLIKKLKRFRLRKRRVPSHLLDESLGLTVKVRELGDGHIACAKCECPFFHAERYTDDPMISIFCAHCNKKIILELPADLHEELKPIHGQFCCARHPKSRTCVIKSGDWLSIGCENCNEEINFNVSGAEGILVQ